MNQHVRHGRQPEMSEQEKKKNLESSKQEELQIQQVSVNKQDRKLQNKTCGQYAQ